MSEGVYVGIQLCMHVRKHVNAMHGYAYTLMHFPRRCLCLLYVSFVRICECMLLYCIHVCMHVSFKDVCIRIYADI